MRCPHNLTTLVAEISKHIQKSSRHIEKMIINDSPDNDDDDCGDDYDDDDVNDKFMKPINILYEYLTV